MIIGGSRRKALRAAMSVSFIWFLLLVILPNWSDRKATMIIPSARSVNLLKQIGTERGALHQNFNLNCVSKRRVPSGPDPIHNRRAGSSKLPPT